MSHDGQKYSCSLGLSRWYSRIYKKSLSFDGCCINHDYIYRHPEVPISRKTSDYRLYCCVYHSGYEKTAKIMHVIVRLFGWMFYEKRNK